MNYPADRSSSDHPVPPPSAAGLMAALLHSHDWAGTALGAMTDWPASLRSSLSICLNARFPIALYWGPDLALLYNDAWRPILGDKHPWALGQPAAVVWPEIWSTIGPLFASVFASGEGVWQHDQLLLMHRHGYTEECYFNFTFSPIWGEDGQVAGIFNAVIETTQHVIGARRLHTLRDLGGRTLAEATTVEDACHAAATTLAANPFDVPFSAIYLLDDDGTAARLYEAVNLAPGTVACPPVVTLGHPEDYWAFGRMITLQQPAVLVPLAAEHGPWPAGPWDDAVATQALVLPLAQSGGQERLAGFLIVGISPRLALDQDYRSFLDLAAGHLATAIANARAYAAERERAEALADLDRTKTAFFSNISHEFRTPLTLMLGPLEDLQAQASAWSPDDRARLDLVQRNAGRLLKLVNTLLDFSRIGAGRLEAMAEPTDLAAYTADLASGFRSTIERAGLRFVVDCAPLGQPVAVDRAMWEKIVFNLLSNAFKFTFIGSVTLTLRRVDDTAVLSVSDTGIGIPATEVPHLFERFHRVKGARGRTFEGSGIGLALVQELVRLHGGSIAVTSAVDQGSTFTLSLPLRPVAAGGATPVLHHPVTPQMPAAWYSADAPDPALASMDDSSSTTSATGAPRVSASLLLADDNADMRTYITRILAPDYAVVAVEDGAAALRVLAQQPIDLILTDVMMPHLDGFGLLTAVRADPGTRTIPVILLSARAGEESRVEGLDAGADDYLIKPFSAKELRARVAAHLSMAHLRQTAAVREQALREEAQAARDRLDEVLARINDQVFALDHAWRYVFVNDQVTQVTGLPRAALIGQCIWDLFPDTIGTPFEQALRQALAEQTPVHFEYAYPALDRWFENHVYPSPSGVTLFVADITARKTTEAALRLSEERVRLALAAADLGTWDVRPDQGVVQGDTRAVALLDLPADIPIAYTTFLAHLHPEDAPHIDAAIQQALDPASDGRVRLEGRRATADDRWLALHGQVVRDSAGQAIRVIGTVLDISEAKRLEAERARLLAQEQQLRLDAEAVSRLKDEFLATVSHELRTPLTALLGYAQMLRSRKRDEAYILRTAERMVHAAKTQAQLIEDLLDVSRIVSGTMRIEPAPLDLITVIHHALDTVRPAIEAKTLDLHTALDPDASAIVGDPHRLEQVVWNLLSNAAKFTPPGGQIQVRLLRDGQDAHLMVADTGQGISPEFLPFVFDRFRQADGTSIRVHGGLGLGMAIVRHLVELHGGMVAVTSPGEGQGATFTVRLPLATSAAMNAPDAAPTSDPACPPILFGRRALVVDDQPAIRELVQEMLAGCGMLVEAVPTARDALARLHTWTPDVLISDIAMPDEDGYWLIAQVRALPAAAGGAIPAIALTAYVRMEERLRTLAAGFQRYVTKPIDIADLRAMVASVLDGDGDAAWTALDDRPGSPA